MQRKLAATTPQHELEAAVAARMAIINAEHHARAVVLRYSVLLGTDRGFAGARTAKAREQEELDRDIRAPSS